MDLEKGGRGAIERMVEAYGFTTRQALCDQLGVSKGTLANRYMRDSFPAEWVIQCALETGASLRWLTMGTGVIFENSLTDIIEIRKKKIIDGKLFDAGYLMFDKALLPGNILGTIAVTSHNDTYLANTELTEIKNGLWLVDIENAIGIHEIVRIPGGRIQIINDKVTIECQVNDIKFLAKIFLKCSFLEA